MAPLSRLSSVHFQVLLLVSIAFHSSLQLLIAAQELATSSAPPEAAHAFSTPLFSTLSTTSLVATPASGRESSSNNSGVQEDVLALLEFKRSIKHDPLGALSSWTFSNNTANTTYTTTVCNHWQGISCNNISGRVEMLVLSKLQLNGPISPALGSLPFLEVLDLSSNLFSGPIPSQLALSTSLLAIDLHDNLLSGNIPPEFGGALRLIGLYLYQNFLTGAIPSSIANAANLKDLALNNNNLSGSIPSQLFDLQDLANLDLYDNHLSGPIPKLAPGSCKSLEGLHIYGNNINGSLPTSISNCKNLTELELWDNQISGNLPDELGALPRIQTIFLSNNLLYGPIPKSLGNSTTLQDLILSFNSLSGPLPLELCRIPTLQGLDLGPNSLSGDLSGLVNCSSLIALKLGSNFFEGSIPPPIGSFMNLGYLDLEFNKMTGHIPSSLGNCSSLSMLLLSGNNLTGQIPTELGHLGLLTDAMLFSNSLSGTIPTSLYNCTKLQELWLDDNQLTGPLQPEIGGLTSLQELILFDNQLSGSIPAEIGQCKSLQNLSLSTNNFSGPIPSSIGSLTLLQELVLDENALSGPVPSTKANLKNLTWLILSYNNLNGTLDVLQLGVTLTKLQVLFLQSNLFTGNIPETLHNCKDLLRLSLRHNQLTGTIPSMLDQLQYLYEVYLGGNHLVGSIPLSIGDCLSLRLLDLAHNELNGSLPSSLGKLSSLSTYLNVSHNALSGPIPAELGNLQLLLNMDLSHNQLTGRIPDLSSCVMLQSLDLSTNHLTGAIPDSMGHLLSLNYLNVSHNILQESIPISLSNLSMLQVLDVSDNELVGPIPSFRNLSFEGFMGNPGLCGDIIHKPCVPSVSSTHSSHNAIIAGSVAAGLVGSVIVAVICYIVLYKGKANHASTGDALDAKIPFLRLSENEINLATNAYSSQNIIGSGGFSTVYKAQLQRGGMAVVAVKVLKMPQEQTSHVNHIEKAFMTELHTLGKLRHRNLVKILGYCLNLDMKAIIMEYLPNGNLEEWLHSGTRGFLTWKQRLDIAIGIAQGLVYLHDEYDQDQCITHCDLKPSNILLDEDMQPHIADFGIARILQPSGQYEQVASTSSTMSAIFQGSVGYMAPEYGSWAKPSMKGDVYSYGVMLLEMVTGRRPTSGDLGEGRSLREWVLMEGGRGHNNMRKEESYADPALIQAMKGFPATEEAGQHDESDVCKQMEWVVQVGVVCTSKAPKDRPCIREVLQHLRKVHEGAATDCAVLQVSN